MRYIQAKQTIVKQVTRWVIIEVEDDEYEAVEAILDRGDFDPDDYTVVEDSESVDDADRDAEFQYDSSW